MLSWGSFHFQCGLWKFRGIKNAWRLLCYPIFFLFLTFKLFILEYIGATGKEFACQCRRRKKRVQSLGGEDPLKKEMATHSSIIAWEIPWTGESGGLQSMGPQRVGHDLVIECSIVD